jgi:hypothetical protein
MVIDARRETALVNRWNDEEGAGIVHRLGRQALVVDGEVTVRVRTLAGTADQSPGATVSPAFTSALNLPM